MIKSYSVILKTGEAVDRIIRGISVQGGELLLKTLSKDPPMFIEIKNRMVARSEIAQIIANEDF